jgi:hypothetical protein
MNAVNPESTNPKLTLTQVEKRINRLAQQSNANTHELGRLYNYVVDSRLAKKPDYKNAKDFFRKRIKGLSQSMLSMYGAVAARFSAESCAKYGMSNLYVLRSYEKAARISADVDDPGPTLIEVPQAEGAPVQKPFADCSVEELKLAVQYKRVPSAPSIPASDLRRIQHYHDTLERFFPDNKRMRLKARLQSDRLLLSLKDIPEKELERFAEAILEWLHPARAAA